MFSFSIRTAQDIDPSLTDDDLVTAVHLVQRVVLIATIAILASRPSGRCSDGRLDVSAGYRISDGEETKDERPRPVNINALRPARHLRVEDLRVTGKR